MDRTPVVNSSAGLWRPCVLAGAIPLIFFTLFYFYPMTGILGKSFFQNGVWAPEEGLQIFVSARIRRILWFTLWQAVVSTLLTLACAMPCAWVLSRFRFPGKRLVWITASVPFVLPAVVVGAALQACAGKNGMFSSILTLPPLALILLAHLFYNFSVMLRILSAFWQSLDRSLADAARMLGASGRQVFFRVTLPLISPAVLAASFLVFMFCFSSFGIILILGGPGYATIETEIYRQAAHLFNLPAAAMLSLLQIGFTLLLMRIYSGFSQKAAVFTPEGDDDAARRPGSLVEKIMVGLTVCFIFVLCGLPMLTLASRSIWHDGSITLAFYQSLFQNPMGSVFHVPPVRAVLWSMAFAFGAMGIALVTGICAAVFIHHLERHFKTRLISFFDPMFMLPLSTSAVTLGFGIIITLDQPPLNLRASAVLVPIAHALVGFPFVIRAVLPALRAIPDDLRDAAAILGASPGRVLRYIDFPLVSRQILAGAVFAFTISLGEFGATIFTARPQTPTLPVAIYQFLSRPGAVNYGQAMAMSTVLMLICALGFLVIERFGTKNTGGI